MCQSRTIPKRWNTHGEIVHRNIQELHPRASLPSPSRPFPSQKNPNQIRDPKTQNQDPTPITQTKQEKGSNKDIEIVVNWGIKVVRETIEVSSGPMESNGTGEHRPKCEQPNGTQCLEFVPSYTKN